MTYAPWTAADQAELDVLTDALLDGIADHALVCLQCQVVGSGLFCERVDQAVRELLRWHRKRSLLSKALYLRRLNA